AGEFIYKTEESINSGFSSIIVGQEGRAASLNNETGFRGGVSYIENKYKANGGGGGASRDGGGRAMTGGSGGGGSNANSNNPPHQQGNISLKLDGGSGNSGGDGEFSTSSWSWFGGGGGGAGSAGVSTSGGSRNDPGHGGNGISNSITGTSIEYAAGGAGAPSRVQGGTTTYPSNGGSNQVGGGNNGSNGIKAPNPNTGSGGSAGGAFSGIGNQNPTAGATGIVIIRYTKGIWSSSDSTIATVITNPDGSAKITAIEGNGGTAIISNSLNPSVYQYEITVSPKLTDGNIDSDQQTICQGLIPDDITYSTLPTAGSKTLNYQWYKKSGDEPAPTGNFNSSGWTIVGNTSSTSADLSGAEIGTLNITTTFALRITDSQQNCFDIWSGQKHVVHIDKHMTPSISSMDILASSSQAYTCTVNDNQWHYFRDDNDKVIAAINSNGQNLGNVTVEVFVENEEPTHGTGSIYDISLCYDTPELTAVRWYDITPEIQPLTPVTVKLFLAATEYTSYVNAINQFKQSTAPNYDFCYGITNSIYDLAISKDEVEDISIIQSSASLISGVTEYEFEVNSFSTFKFHTNGGDGVPLPVELISFIGYNQTNTNVLEWETASERNTEVFEVEHSINGVDWEKIGTVAASGFSNVPLSYTYTDNNPLKGNNQYRLKMVDLDNTFEYSRIINIHVTDDQLSYNIMTVYPNPSTDIFNISIKSTENYIGVIQIMNVQGQIIQTLNRDINKGENTIQINLNSLPQGIYILNTIHLNGLISTEKIIKK
ncbi:MAG TPA: T9SS type A sorting domain-containing protein, partial [Chitinophagales bacterium]|nr:T9SS type A sorting domain-containing protein [Chitinophagales bacterium]